MKLLTKRLLAVAIVIAMTLGMAISAMALDNIDDVKLSEAGLDPAKSEIVWGWIEITDDSDADGKSIEADSEYVTKNADGTYTRGIEDYLPRVQYQTEAHQNGVVDDICDNWTIRSLAGKFHAIYATSSIPEAIEYYRIFKKKAPHLKVTALFDPHIENSGNFKVKEEGLKEIILD